MPGRALFNVSVHFAFMLLHTLNYTKLHLSCFDCKCINVELKKNRGILDAIYNKQAILSVSECFVHWGMDEH